MVISFLFVKIKIDRIFQCFASAKVSVSTLTKCRQMPETSYAGGTCNAYFLSEAKTQTSCDVKTEPNRGTEPKTACLLQSQSMRYLVWRGSGPDGYFIMLITYLHTGDSSRLWTLSFHSCVCNESKIRYSKSKPSKETCILSCHVSTSTW